MQASRGSTSHSVLDNFAFLSETDIFGPQKSDTPWPTFVKFRTNNYIVELAHLTCQVSSKSVRYVSFGTYVKYTRSVATLLPSSCPRAQVAPLQASTCDTCLIHQYDVVTCKEMLFWSQAYLHFYEVNTPQKPSKF